MRLPALAIFLCAASLPAQTGTPAAAASAAAPSVTRVQAAPAADAGVSQDAADSRDAVQDKFRRLQKEMSSRDRGLAATPGRQGAAPAAEPRGLLSVSLQILLGLAAVLILAVFTIRLLKRFQGRILSKPGQAGGDLFEVLETCHLGNHQRVVALRMHGEVGILGVTPQGISLLTTLKETPEELGKARGARGNPAAFADSLNKLMERFKKPKRLSDFQEEA